MIGFKDFILNLPLLLLIGNKDSKPIKDMSQILVYVPLEKYLSEWLTTKLGNPVVFPVASNENAVIRAFLQKRPADADVQTADPTATAICIPDSTAKPVETYNYLGAKGKAAVKEAIKDLFIRNLWADMTPLDNSRLKLSTRIAAWCEKAGIGLDRVETVRQCYYRIRKSYSERDINLRNSTRNRNSE